MNIHKEVYLFKMLKFGIDKGVFTVGEFFDTFETDETDPIVKTIFRWADKRSALNIPSPMDEFFMYVDNVEVRKKQELREVRFRTLPSAYFRYYDIVELQEARKSSRKAKIQSTKAYKIAFYSLIISGLVGILQIVISLVK